MSVYWKLSDEEAEELSGLLFRHYAEQRRKRGGKESAELAMKYWSRLTCRVDERKRSAEPGGLHECPVTFLLDDGEYGRLCALQGPMSCREPEDVLGFALTVGSASLIKNRLRRVEWAYLGDGEEEAEEEAEE